MAVQETQKIHLGIHPPRIDLSRINPFGRIRELLKNPQREEFDSQVLEFKTTAEEILNKSESVGANFRLDSKQSELYEDVGRGLTVTIGVKEIKKGFEMTIVDSGGNGEKCVVEGTNARFFEIMIGKNSQGGITEVVIEHFSSNDFSELKLLEMQKWVRRLKILESIFGEFSRVAS